MVVFLFHTDNKPEVEPPVQIQRLKSALCHHVPLRGRRQRVLPCGRRGRTVLPSCNRRRAVMSLKEVGRVLTYTSDQNL